MKEDIDQFLDSLLKATRDLCGAMEQSDLDKAGAVLDTRARLIGGAPGELKGYRFTDAQRERIGRILNYDARAAQAAGRAKSALAEKLKRSKKMNAGRMEYFKSNVNLESGQIMDKKR